MSDVTVTLSIEQLDRVLTMCESFVASQKIDVDDMIVTATAIQILRAAEPEGAPQSLLRQRLELGRQIDEQKMHQSIEVAKQRANGRPVTAGQS